MEKIWLNQYPPTVPHNIDTGQLAPLSEMIESTLERYRQRGAFSCMGSTVSFDRFDQLSSRFAAYLQNELGFGKGDCIAIMLPNILQYPIVLFGAIRAGVTVTSVNPLYTPRELEHQLRDSKAKAIVILANFAHTLERVISTSDIGDSLKHIIVTKIGDYLGFPKSVIVSTVVKYVKKMVPRYNLPGAVPLNKVTSMGELSTLNKPDWALDDIAFLQYTGGTTGVSKGAMLSHRSVAANIVQFRIWANPVYQGDDHAQQIFITPLPLYHIFALVTSLVYFFWGGLNVLITNPRDIPGLIKELTKWKFSAITGVNTLFNAMLNHPSFGRIDFSELKLSLGAGMTIHKTVADRWQQVTGNCLIEAYGLTEASPGVSANRTDSSEHTGSVGLPLPPTDVKICDKNNEPVPCGQPGELWVKGPQVMLGYWQQPNETAQVLTDDGWLRTGDVATMDEKGSLYIVERLKDMVLVSGFNVYPNEVEEVICAHEGVLEAAVIGRFSKVSGEKIKAFIVRKDPNLTEEKIIAHCRKNLTGYKVPKEIEFRTDLPKSNVGKILRRLLRDQPV